MSERPARLRQRIPEEAPATPPSIRRLYWYGGAALGVVAGVVIALFVVPALFNRYFGVADIALGHTYRNDGLALRVVSAGLTPTEPGRFVIVLDVLANEAWCPDPSDFRLELISRVSVAGAALTPGPEACVEGRLAAAVLSVSFASGARGPEQLHILHVDHPRVRFWLQPGEPR
jgi:hypothetical protein